MTSISVNNANISQMFYWLWDNLVEDEYAYLGSIAHQGRVMFHFKDDAHAVMFKLAFYDAPHNAR
jgi:hypothetical protein